MASLVVQGRARSARLLALAVMASLAADVVAMVNCGGHFDLDCAACPAGNGETWCNGECEWVSTGVTEGQCMPILPPLGSQNLYYYLAGFFLFGIVMLIYTCCYHRKIIKGPPEFPKVNSIMNAPPRGICDCFWNLDTCIQVTFCLPVVVAKNYYATDVCPFWPACCLSFLGTYSPFYFVNACFRAYNSQRVQEKLGLPSNYFWNLLMAMFCYPCDVGRESIAVDMEVGAEIKCCCMVYYAPVEAEVEKIGEKIEDFVEKTERRCGCWEPGH